MGEAKLSGGLEIPSKDLESMGGLPDNRLAELQKCLYPVYQ